MGNTACLPSDWTRALVIEVTVESAVRSLRTDLDIGLTTSSVLDLVGRHVASRSA